MLILVLVTLVNLFLIAVALEMARVYREEVDQTLNRNLAANIIKDGWLDYGETVDKDTFSQAVNRIGAVNPRIEIYLLDLSGNILSYSGSPETLKRRSVSLTPIAAFLDQLKELPILGDDPRDINERKIFSVAPIYNRNAVTGYLYVVVGGKKYDSVTSMLQNSYVLRLALATSVGGLLVAVAAGLAAFNFLTRRLRRLAKQVDAFRRSDGQQTNSSTAANAGSGSDEIDQIADTFAKMSQRIDSQLYELKVADETRRDFLASVSHDLRTPLSALRGYIETILMKTDSLSDEQKTRYLTLALKNGEKLHDLVDNLFRLSILDTGQWPRRSDVFSINDLVREVCQRLELRARQRDILFAIDMARDDALVEGDSGLIERVLDNLIDNAIKFTLPGGCVSVCLETAGDFAIVEIRDTGIGIHQEHLPRIFEPFYCITLRSAHASGGTGLGLTIASRIIELHHSRIEVESTPGEGTIFRFRLALATSDGPTLAADNSIESETINHS
jgi:signal transduction histidine kinase